MLFQGLKVRGLFYVPLALLFGVAISASIAYAGLQTGPHEVSIQGAQQVDHPCDRLLQLSSSASCFRPLKGSGRAVPEGGDTNRLEWVAAVSSNDIWAVGYYYDQQVGVYRTL